MEGLKQRLLNKIRNEFYCSRNELRAYSSDLNYDSATCDRKLRELTEQGKIRPDIDKKFIKGYFYNNGNICRDQSSIVNTNQECTELTGVEFEKMAMKQYLEEQQKEQVTKPSQKRLMI